MTITGQKILDSCIEHVKNGGFLVAGLDGVICHENDDIDEEMLLEWEFKNDLRECCALGTVVAGKPINSEFMDDDAASILDVSTRYTEAFIKGFDKMPLNPDYREEEEGFADAKELRDALDALGIKVREVPLNKS